jgi:hypothetical protein
VTALRTSKSDIETITEIYLLDEEGGSPDAFHSSVWYCKGDSSLSGVPQGHMVSTTVDANGRKVANSSTNTTFAPAGSRSHDKNSLKSSTPNRSSPFCGPAVNDQAY